MRVNWFEINCQIKRLESDINPNLVMCAHDSIRREAELCLAIDFVVPFRRVISDKQNFFAHCLIENNEN